MKPFIKWVGGKSKLVKILEKKIPIDYNTYVEPFIGGGALFFYLKPKKAIISDINSKLINTYIQIRDNITLLIDCLKSIPVNEFEYKRIRKEFNECQELNYKMAAYFIYLNKSSFGGVYRENSKGYYNVPFAKGRVKISIDYENLLEISEYLKSNDVQILCQPFEKTITILDKNDFVYIDPPYVKENVNSFTKYNKQDFNNDDCERLLEMVSNKCKWIMSNSESIIYCDFIHEYNYELIQSTQSMAKKKKNEVVVFKKIIHSN